MFCLSVKLTFGIAAFHCKQRMTVVDFKVSSLSSTASGRSSFQVSSHVFVIRLPIQRLGREFTFRSAASIDQGTLSVLQDSDTFLHSQSLSAKTWTNDHCRRELMEVLIQTGSVFLQLDSDLWLRIMQRLKLKDRSASITCVDRLHIIVS